MQPPEISKRPSIMASGHSNQFQTPPEAINSLLPYLPEWYIIWECAQGKGNLTDAFANKGYKVIATDILDGFDFLTYEPSEKYDVIITNPPFSHKDEFLKRAYALKKPFAFLLPLTTFEGKIRQFLFREHGIQVVFNPKRFNFEVPSGKKSSSWFATAWFCFGLNLPKDMNFSEVI